MTKIKNIILVLVSIIVIVALILNFNTIADKLTQLFNATPDVIIQPANEYKKEDKFKLVSQVDDYVPYSYQDLLNIFYSTLNQGWEDFTFYCPVEYSECLKDVEKISLDEELLSDINNYVHPYNSYVSIKTLYDDSGRVKILVSHLYSKDEIKFIESYIDNTMNELLKNDMDLEDKIKELHDYIIDSTKYDAVRAEKNESQYDSARMTGLIKEHYAICSGYADIMAVFLNRLNVPNFKISSENHIWNALYINGKWLHLDLTWDDPITNNGRDVIEHSYFLINNQKLKNLAKGNKDHIFDKKRYIELDY